MRSKSVSARQALWLLFGLSLGIRLAHVWAIRAHPLFIFPTVDAEAYDLWARSILEGRWLGSKVFYQDPLYPYFLALFYRLAGRNLLALAAFQCVLDSATVVMIALLGKRLFSSTVGAIAGVGAALYGAAIFYVGVFEKTTVSLFLIVAALSALLRAADGPRRKIPSHLIAGAILGLALLMRGNLFLFIPAVFLWSFSIHRALARNRILAIELSLAAGLALAILPVTIRNWVVGRDFVVTTSQAGWNFYVGTARESTGWLATPRGVRTVPAHEEEDNRRLAEQALGRPLRPSAVSRYWFGQGLRFIVTQPGAYLRVLGAKLLLAVNAVELPDSYDYYFYRGLSPALAVMRLGFGLIFPIGLAGLLVAWRERAIDKKRALLVYFLGAYTCSLLIFYVTGRYRLPLAPILLLFAAYAVHWLRRKQAARAYRPMAVFGLAAAAFFCLGHLPVGTSDAAGSHFLAGNSLADHGFPAQALEQYLKALPGNENRPELQLNLGIVLQKLGRSKESLQAFHRALQLNPADPQAYDRLAEVYRQSGEPLRAQVFTALGDIHSGRSPADFSRLVAALSRVPTAQRLEGYGLTAFALYKFGRIPEAQMAWQASLQIKPDQPGVLMNLFLTTESSDPLRAMAYLKRYLAVANADVKERPKIPEARRRLAALEQRLYGPAETGQ